MQRNWRPEQKWPSGYDREAEMGAILGVSVYSTPLFRCPNSCDGEVDRGTFEFDPDDEWTDELMISTTCLRSSMDGCPSSLVRMPTKHSKTLGIIRKIFCSSYSSPTKYFRMIVATFIWRARKRLSDESGVAVIRSRRHRFFETFRKFYL